MTRYFTQYWRNDTWDLQKSNGHDGVHIEHTADNHFRAKGIAKGDRLYVVTIRQGRLHLLCRGIVDLVTDQYGAARRLDVAPGMLWDASTHLLLRSDDGARQVFNRSVPVADTRRLEALRVGGARPLKFIDARRLDQQSLRGVCEITPAAAQVLDRLIDNGMGQTVTRDSRASRKLPGAPGDVIEPSFIKEREFEMKVVEPLIGRWGFAFERQHRRYYQRGRQTSSMIIDHLVSDATGHLTLFENKQRISSDSMREAAAKQAKSYAHDLNLASFVVAAPEGMWIYSLWRGEIELVHEVVPIDRLRESESHLRQHLLDIREQFSLPRPRIVVMPPDSRGAVGHRPSSTSIELPTPPPGLAIHSLAAKAHLDALVLHLVREAGTIPQDKALANVRSAWALRRSGRRVREAFEASVARLQRKGRVRRARDKERTLTASEP